MPLLCLNRVSLDGTQNPMRINPDKGGWSSFKARHDKQPESKFRNRVMMLAIVTVGGAVLGAGGSLFMILYLFGHTGTGSDGILLSEVGVKTLMVVGAILGGLAGFFFMLRTWRELKE